MAFSASRWAKFAAGPGGTRTVNTQTQKLTINSNNGITIGGAATKLSLEGPVAVDGNIQASTTNVFGTDLPPQITNISAVSGSDIANDTATINLTVLDHGKTYLSVLASATKQVVLPGNVSTTDIGTQITIIQNADLVNSGIYSCSAGPGNTFAVNSFAIGYNSNRVLPATRPNGTTNNQVKIAGVNSNSAWGLGSKMVFTCVAANKWHFDLKAVPLGSGNDGITFESL